MSFVIHCQALSKMFNKSYVMPNTTPNKFENLFNQISASNCITFIDDEIDLVGTVHIKALYISLKYKKFIVAKVLVNNGSALNVLPMITLE